MVVLREPERLCSARGKHCQVQEWLSCHSLPGASQHTLERQGADAMFPNIVLIEECVGGGEGNCVTDRQRCGEVLFDLTQC